MIDAEDPDNFPYDNVEFPVRKPVSHSSVNRYTPSPRSTQPTTPEKVSLAPVFESAFELNSIDTPVSVGNTSTSVNITLQNTSMSSSTEHTSPVLFTNAKPHKDQDFTPAANHTQVTQPPSLSQPTQQPATSPVTARTSSPITKLKTSMVESKQLINEDRKTEKAATIVRPPEPVTWPFGKNDFNPHSQKVLDDAFIEHAESHDDLNSFILVQGHSLQKPLHSTKEKVKERLTYEQLLQGMLFDGERLLLNGHWIYFNRVEFLNETGDKATRPALGYGRACLTNRRILFLVAESSTDADLKKMDLSSYVVSLSQRDDVIYISLPIHSFRSVELGVSVGASASINIKKVTYGCGCLKKKKWSSGKALMSSHNKRTIQLGVLMPPWNTPTVVLIHTHADLPLTLIRDFVSYVQTYAQQLH